MAPPASYPATLLKVIGYLDGVIYPKGSVISSERLQRVTPGDLMRYLTRSHSILRIPAMTQVQLWDPPPLSSTRRRYHFICQIDWWCGTRYRTVGIQQDAPLLMIWSSEWRKWRCENKECHRGHDAPWHTKNIKRRLQSWKNTRGMTRMDQWIQYGTLDV